MTVAARPPHPLPATHRNATLYSTSIGWRMVNPARPEAIFTAAVGFARRVSDT